MKSKLKNLKIEESHLPKISEHTIYKQNRDGSYSVLKISDEDTYFTIEGPAARIWKLMNGKRSIQSLIRLVASTNQISTREASLHLKKFIKTLLKEGLVTI